MRANCCKSYSSSALAVAKVSGLVMGAFRGGGGGIDTRPHIGGIIENMIPDFFQSGHERRMGVDSADDDGGVGLSDFPGSVPQAMKNVSNEWMVWSGFAAPVFRA